MTEVMSPQPFLAVRIFGAHFERPRSPSSEPPGLGFHTSFLLPSSVKVIAFDLFGTVFDREAAIMAALTTLLSNTAYTDKVKSLTRRFLTHEALIVRETPLAPYTDIARKALRDVCAGINIPVSQLLLDTALEDLLRPHLHPDVLESLATLHADGLALVGLSRIDETTFDLHFKESIPHFIRETVSGRTCSLLGMLWDNFFPTLIPVLRDLYPGVETSSVLVVTASPTISLIPAHAAGFPSALVDRPNSVVLKSACKLFNDKVAIRQGDRFSTPFVLSDFWYCDAELGTGSFASVFGGSNVVSGEALAVKLETLSGHAKQKEVLPYEAMIYRRLRGHPGIPSVHWSGRFDISNVLVLDKLGPTLQDLRRVCRGRFSLKTISMLALQMLNRIEFVHSRNLIIRDVKPENFAMGLGEDASTVYLFDFGLAKLFEDPVTGKHIPYREGRDGMGTPRYCSYNMEYGRDQSRRDDLEALGNTFLFFYHGRLPWQGIYAPTIPWKFQRIGEMKSAKVFQDLLLHSPPEFDAYFQHVRGLAFEDKPDYALLSSIFERRMEEEGWKNDGAFDWIDPCNTEKGTLVPGIR
ncbi:kinase-like domain-containing protein [Amylostereum chailletii]|nr:kinase-like domain-containing protein [Amylostereum chailletii]